MSWLTENSGMRLGLFGLTLVPMLALALTGTAVAGTVTQETRGSVGLSWQENPSAPGVQQVNITRTPSGIAVADGRLHPAASHLDRGYGLDLLAPRSLAAPVNQVSVETRAELPSGAVVEVDVRGQTGSDRWTEWRPAPAGGAALLGHTVTIVQTRIILWDNATGASPRVSGLRLTGRYIGQATTRKSPITALTYQVFATREGLVGGTTANGHVIQSNDHFVALPSGLALSPAGSGQFSVQVCGPSRCETAPVWDIGPWNTRDNYWDASGQRQEFQDLPQGTPEAQAAFNNGYNGGNDESGRHVANPAGIDLADGTFFNVGLNNNGFVTVTYLWTNG